MKYTKKDCIKQQLELNKQYILDKKYPLDGIAQDTIDKQTIELEKLLNTIGTNIDTKITISRMLNNVITYIKTGKTSWTNENINKILDSIECIHCDKKVLKTSAVWDYENEIWYCPKCANKLGI